MPTRLRIDGLQDLIRSLRDLPSELVAEAGPLVTHAAHAAVSDMHYPVHSGNLQKKLTVVEKDGASGRFGTAAVVKNTAKHAHLFELGTQARHTGLGANRGSMPVGKVFLPAVIRRRRQMYDALADLLARHGLTVTGTA